MDFIPAPDIKTSLIKIISKLHLDYINQVGIYAFRSLGSSSRARARIWSFPRIWQLALDLPPCYIIEVLSERFDKLSPEDKERTLIHELMHIPKNFSGALVPHRTRYKKINSRSVENLFNIYKSKSA